MTVEFGLAKTSGRKVFRTTIVRGVSKKADIEARVTQIEETTFGIRP